MGGFPDGAAGGRPPTVADMDSFFSFMKNLGFRRGPGRAVAGIAGGVAQHTGWDPLLVRLLMLVSFLLPVLGPTLYLVLWLILPWQDGTIPLQRFLDRRGGAPTIVQDPGS